MLKSFEVNNLTLYIDDDQSNLRALLLDVDDDDQVSCLSVCVCVTKILISNPFIF